MLVECKRAYDEASLTDGYRVLVDQLWPRGVKKEALCLDDWMKELAPSTELRKWFGHDPERWAIFCKRYQKELESRAEALNALREKAGNRKITLIYGAKDREHNNAVALKAVLENE